MKYGRRHYRRITTWAAVCATMIMCATTAAAQTAASAMPQPELNAFVDNTGTPYAGGFLCSFSAGTTTPLATYQDSGASINNTNPIVLDSNGRASVYILPTGYKFILYIGGNGNCPGSGTVAWSQDNVYSSLQNVNTLNSFFGTLNIVGTANQVIVSNSSNTITLSTPQSIAATSSPTFVNLTLTGNLNVSGTCTGCGGGPANQTLPTRNAGTIYHNTQATAMFVAVTQTVQPGAVVTIYTGSASPPTVQVTNTYCYNASPYPCFPELFFVVLPGWYYEAVITGASAVLTNWVEWY